MSFTADSRQFAIWSANGVTIINLENLEESFINNDHNDWYNAGYVALALSPDSQTVVLWSYTEMELFDLSSLELISTLNLNNGDFISAIAFEANGSHLIVGRSGGAVDIEVYDYVSGQSVFSMNGHEDTAFSVASHPRYPLFITGSRDGAIKLWDLDAESDSPLFQSMLDWAVYDVAFSPDGRYLIASSDRLLQIWSIE
jgi:WD40 repeat protein